SFFFFQAEDGIRDRTVTGVQTCALPIYPVQPTARRRRVPSPFGSLVDTFLKEEYEDSPTLATSLGLTEYDDRLDDTSAARFQKRIERDDAWLDRFRGVGEADLSAGERIDRELLVSMLRGRELTHTLEGWRR